MKSKLANQLNEEELLRLLNVETNEQTSEVDSIKEFLELYKLSPGNHRIPVNLLKNLYKQNFGRPKKDFTHKLTLYIPVKNGCALTNTKLDILSSALLAIVQEKEDVVVKRRRLHFLRFLNRFDLKPGNTIVRYSLIEELYNKWVNLEHPNAKRINPNIFKKFIGVYFKTIKTKYLEVKLNKEIQELVATYGIQVVEEKKD